MYVPFCSITTKWTSHTIQCNNIKSITFLNVIDDGITYLTMVLRLVPKSKSLIK